MEIKLATEVRKHWSETCDEVIRSRPSFIRRTRDLMILCSANSLLEALSPVRFNMTTYKEEDGSVTISSDDLDLVENGETLAAAKESMAASILDYANEYYASFSLYSSAPNRNAHIPYVYKALLLNSVEKIEEELHCRAGKI